MTTPSRNEEAKPTCPGRALPSARRLDARFDSQPGRRLGRAVAALPALVSMALGGLPAAGQESPPERFEEEVVVSEVLLDAVVTDKRGRVILGLGPDDFVVRENGRELEVLAVRFYSAYAPEPAAPPDLPGFAFDEIPADRHFVLFLQEPFVGGGSLGKLRQRLLQAGSALEAWVTAGLTPSDRVAVASFRRHLAIHQDFTADRERLRRAIQQAVRGVDPESEWPSRRRPESEIGPLLRALPSGKVLRKRTSGLHQALRLLAAAASTVGGRKNLVYVGTGFDALDSGESYRISRTADVLNDANVAAYTVDLLTSEFDHSSRGSLQSLALATGGEMFFNFIDFASPLERIDSGTSGYYLIAYRSEHPAGKAGFQRVQVQVPNPEFRVRARLGYAYGE